MSASRSRRCSPTIPISPRTPPSWSCSTSRNCRPLLRADAAPGEFEPGRSHRAGDRAQGLWRRRRRFPQRACDGRARARRSAAIPACRSRPAARSRATTPPATCSNCMAPPRCRIGTATRLPRMLGRGASSVHLYEGHVGGGFGIRGELYPEDVLVCVAALRLRRPVKWIEDRREHLIAANHSRQQLHRMRAAVDRDGRILAIDDEFFHDQGAYVRTHAATVPDLAAAMLPGPVSRAGLSRRRPCPADQQDAVRHLSRAGPLREHLRARAADGRHRRQARPRSRSRCAGAI